jgi:hypothetical protein|tara:strand:- start:1861 stop:2289 length:429 start_codon:yes stop_codon:yes gene_type:complete
MADYYDEDAPSSNSKISKINAASLINLIIAELWKDSHRHSRTGDLSKWNSDLNCIWVELAGDVEAGKEDEEEYQRIDGELVKLGSLGLKKVTGFEQTPKDDNIRKAKQYKLLIEKAVFLKRLQNKQGKGTAYHDDSEDYMDV